MQNTTTGERNHDETLFLFRLINVEFSKIKTLQLTNMVRIRYDEFQNLEK